VLVDSIKQLERELETLTIVVRQAHELAFPRDLELEIARLWFLLYQKRGREMAIHHNYLAVCHRIGIDPNG
jgi:hypothetical protein